MNADLVNELREQNAALRLEVQALREAQALQLQGQAGLAEPTARQLIVALEWWIGCARDPQRPGHATAKRLLTAYVQIHREAIATASNIFVPGGNGRG